MNDDRDQDYRRALAAFHRAVHAAQKTWADTRDEPWPGWGNMSPQQLAELGIPELPAQPEPEPLPPHLDPLDPGFVVHWLLHPSMYTAVPDPSRPPGYQAAVQAKVEAQKAILRDARDALRGSEPQRAPGKGLIDLDTEEGLEAYIAEQERELEAEEYAHQAYMKFIEHLAASRGQTLDQYLLEAAESEDRKRKHKATKAHWTAAGPERPRPRKPPPTSLQEPGYRFVTWDGALRKGLVVHLRTADMRN